MTRDSIDRVMKCPKCGRSSLKEMSGKVMCSFCGYHLSPGQATNFRLYQLLEREEKQGTNSATKGSKSFRKPKPLP